MDKYLAVSGNMGSGKTSLVDFLSKRYPVRPIFEPNDTNPYLSDFYKDMKRWAFQSQIYFLTAKLRLHRELEEYPGSVIQDRTIYEDAEIFALNLKRGRCISKRDFETYWALYQAIARELRPPDVMIYLRCSVGALRRRITNRGRPSEKNVPVSYLRRLHRLYEDWIGRYDLSPVIEIPTDRVDYVTDIVDRFDVLKMIEKYL
jgi:deoxyadenosine/deoxycytidine kinase